MLYLRVAKLNFSTALWYFGRKWIYQPRCILSCCVFQVYNTHYPQLNPPLASSVPSKIRKCFLQYPINKKVPYLRSSLLGSIVCGAAMALHGSMRSNHNGYLQRSNLASETTAPSVLHPWETVEQLRWFSGYLGEGWELVKPVSSV